MLFPRHSHKQAPSLAQFIQDKKLGQGTYGQVHKYIHKITLLPYAIKRICFKGKGKRDIMMIQKQLQILYQIKNPYIVQLIDHFQIVQNYEVYLIMEYIQGGDLHKTVYKNNVHLSTEQVATIIYQVASGLAELHANNIIHRDLKIENVVYLPNGSIKLVDLGCSNYYGQDIQRLTSIGTKIYYSPEIVTGDSQDDRLDIWCLGVLMYELLFLMSPFKGTNYEMKIRHLDYSIPATHVNDKQLVDLFSKIFCYKNSRIRIKQVIDHPWIQKYAKKENMHIDVEIEGIPQKDIMMYKEFLLEEISKCERDIQNLKDCNEKLKRKIQFDEEQQDDVF